MLALTWDVACGCWLCCCDWSSEPLGSVTGVDSWEGYTSVSTVSETSWSREPHQCKLLFQGNHFHLTQSPCWLGPSCDLVQDTITCSPSPHQDSLWRCTSRLLARACPTWYVHSLCNRTHWGNYNQQVGLTKPASESSSWELLKVICLRGGMLF